MKKYKEHKVYGEFKMIFVQDDEAVGIHQQTVIEESAPEEVKQAIRAIAKIVTTSFPDIIRQVATKRELQ